MEKLIHNHSSISSWANVTDWHSVTESPLIHFLTQIIKKNEPFSWFWDSLNKKIQKRFLEGRSPKPKAES